MGDFESQTEGQFRELLDNIVDYSKHDSLIKELTKNTDINVVGTVNSSDGPSKSNSNNNNTRNNTTNSTNSPRNNIANQKGNNNTATINNTKPAASLNSSTYTSAASSNSSSASDSSTSSSSCLSNSASSASSTTSSTSTSPSQSQSQVCASLANDVPEHCKLEMAKPEELGKKAEILEHCQATLLIQSSSLNFKNEKKILDKTSKSTSSSNILRITNPVNFGRPIIRDLGLNADSGYEGIRIFQNGSPDRADDSEWHKKESRKERMQRKKEKIQPEKKIFAEQIPGHRGDSSVEELTRFIESKGNGSTNSNQNNKNKHKVKPQNTFSNTSNSHNIGNNYANIHNTTNMSNTKRNGCGLQNQSKLTQTPVKNGNTKMNIRNPSQQLSQTHKSHPTINNDLPVSITNVPGDISFDRVDDSCVSMPPSFRKETFTSELVSLTNLTLKPSQCKVKPCDSTNITKMVSLQTMQQSQEAAKKSPEAQLNRCTPIFQYKKKSIDDQVNGFVNDAKDSQISCSNEDDETLVVTFAEHLKVHDEVAQNYTFGFFENQTSLDDRLTEPKMIDGPEQLATKTPSTQADEKSQSSKLIKTSPVGKKIHLKSKIVNDTVNYNYDQILKFISDAWVNSQAKQPVASRKP